MNYLVESELFERIALLLHSSRQKVLNTVNHTMVQTYFEIGRMIVEDELQGNKRAKYAQNQLKLLSQKLTDKFGKGFSISNLKNMRQFYLTYDKQFKLLVDDLLKLQSKCQTASGELREKRTKRQTLSSELDNKDIGQMQMYVNYYDREMRVEGENKTIGLILCQDKNQTLVEYTLPEDNDQIFASKYQTTLPSKESLLELLNS